MENVKKIIVSVQFNESEIELGELVMEGRDIYFKYYSDFIARGLEISPLKLKLNSEINKANTMPFDGLFGVFADSLPDGWGKLLLDRALMAKGIDINSLTMLDRLAYVGRKGMGALIYKPEIVNENRKQFELELDDIAKATSLILSGSPSDILDELYILGGPSGGARPHQAPPGGQPRGIMEGPPLPNQEGMPLAGPRMPMVQAIDLNGDGTIDSKEIDGAVRSLKKLDRNGDGNLTTDEYRGAMPGGRPGGPGESGNRDMPNR